MLGHSLPGSDTDLVWPAESVPVVHVLKGDVVKFSKACSQGLQALLAKRNMRETIDNAADCFSTQTTYCWFVFLIHFKPSRRNFQGAILWTDIRWDAPSPFFNPYK
jgi:hypothetical protein